MIRKVSATSEKSAETRGKAGEREGRSTKDEEEMEKDERGESGKEKRGKEARSVLRTSEISGETGFWFVPRNVTQLNRPERRN